MGAYGKVRKCSLKGQSSETQYAVKIYNRDQCDEGQLRHFVNECNALVDISHENIIRLLEFREDGIKYSTSGKQKPVLYIVEELAPKGQLLDCGSLNAFPENIARLYFKQLLEGIEFLHKSRTCHRDLKLENFLLDSDFKLKISDFGFASELRSNQEKMFSCKGTMGYMAPEIFMGTGYSGEQADLFACGVVLFCMLLGRPPFKMAQSSDPYYFHIANGDF